MAGTVGSCALTIAPKCLRCGTSLAVIAEGRPDADSRAVIMKCQHVKCRREWLVRVTMQPVAEPRIDGL